MLFVYRGEAALGSLRRYAVVHHLPHHVQADHLDRGRPCGPTTSWTINLPRSGVTLRIDQEDDVPWPLYPNWQDMATFYTVLTSVPSPHTLVFSRQWEPYDTKYPFFMQDDRATFLVELEAAPVLETLSQGLLGEPSTKSYHFHTHYEPTPARSWRR